MNIKQNIFKKSLLSLAVAGVASTSIGAVAASDSELKDVEVITVTATRTQLNIDDALTNQVIITREDIELANPISVLDLLSSVPSIDIASNGGRGQNASIFMRGTNSDHTLVLVDGVRVSSATSGGTSFNTISPEMIERIEIVQGPRAALWGSDAIGGVIQIFTRKLDNGEMFAGASFGSDNYKKYAAGIGIGHGEGQTSITVSKEKSDGFDAREGTETDDDGYDLTAVAVRGQQRATEQLSFEWFLSSDRGDTEFDGFFNGSKIKNHAWLVRANYQNDLNGYNNNTVFSLGQNRDSSQSLKNGEAKGIFETRRDQYSLVNNTQFSDDMQLNLGVDHYVDDVSKSTTVYDKEKRNTTGIFAHGLLAQGAWTYEATLRHDSVEKINSENTYNLGVGYKVNEDSRLVLNYGTGFKVPTYNDLYFPGFGTPTLDSELSKTMELFYETQFAGVNANISVYRSNITDLIGRRNGKADNFEKVDITGAEVKLNYLGLGGRHELNLAYTDAEDQATKEQLIRRAKEKLNYKFTTDIKGVDLYAEYQFVGSRTDSVFGKPAPVELPAFQLVNLGASYDLTDNLAFSARVTNLLDKKYQTVATYNTQERAVYFGVSYKN